MQNLKYLLAINLLFIKIILADSCPLFRQFPTAQANLDYITFCNLPTPITPLKKLGQKFGHTKLYLKRDDLAGNYPVELNQIAKTANYGSNKVRKLEWLIADALKHNADTVMTYGCAGSNHALATCMYAQAFGLKTILMLLPQPNSSVVRQNLIMNLHLGAHMHYFTDRKSRDEAAKQLLLNTPSIYFIPTGGSNEIGAIGYVNAIFELCEQINDQVINKPDHIYVPVGSCGTTAGMLLGLALAKLDTKIIAVAIEPEPVPGFFKQELELLFQKTNQLLNSKDANIPLVNFPEDNLLITHQFGQNDYGEWSEQDHITIKLISDLERINLEGTYSSKPFSALIHDLTTKQNTTPQQTILIWETYCGLNFDQSILKQHDFHELPTAFHAYFS